MDADSLFAVMDKANPAHFKSPRIDFHTEINGKQGMPELEEKKPGLRNSSWFAKWLVVMYIHAAFNQGKHAEPQIRILRYAHKAQLTYKRHLYC